MNLITTTKLIAPLGIPHATQEGACEVLHHGLQDLLDRCEDMGIFVYILTEVPFQKLTPEQWAIRARFQGLSAPTLGVSLDDHRQHQRLVDSVMNQLKGNNFRVIPLADVFWTTSGNSMIAFEGRALYWDDDHLSSAGAEAMLTPLLTHMLSGDRE